MADNIYLLETRLSREQHAALDLIRDVARANALTVFLVGGAVRDLISGTAVRDLDVAVQGDVRKLRTELQNIGAVITGESDLWQAIFLTLPGGVRMEVSSTLSVTYPKPGKPVVAPATILEDLRRRDFTANAMALSLNEGSYGLLMDPLNGVADIENRQLRLVSNYGFIEDPALILRAARFMGRLGWTLEEKTQTRYETSREENYIDAIDDFHRGYETEELFHEEDPLRVMRRLEEEGWLAHLSSALSSAKANVAELGRLREVQSQLQLQGVVPDPAVLLFPILTAKLSPDEVQALKKSFPRQGFVTEIESIEAAGKEFVSAVTSKAASQPSQAYRLIRSTPAEAVLWAAFSSKNASLQTKFKSFFGDWPQARQRIPYTLLQEMRITPELPGYDDLVEKLFLELMDGRLDTVEAMKAFLEPYSPPAPPPPVSLRRPRAAKKESSKAPRSRKKSQAADPEVDPDTDLAPDEDVSDSRGDLDDSDEVEDRDESDEQDSEGSGSSQEPEDPDEAEIQASTPLPLPEPAASAPAPTRAKPSTRSAKQAVVPEAAPAQLTPPPARKAAPPAKALPPKQAAKAVPPKAQPVTKSSTQKPALTKPATQKSPGKNEPPPPIKKLAPTPVPASEKLAKGRIAPPLKTTTPAKSSSPVKSSAPAKASIPAKSVPPAPPAPKRKPAPAVAKKVAAPPRKAAPPTKPVATPAPSRRSR